MITRVRASHAGRKRSSSPLPKAVTERTDRLVEISDYCADSKKIAEDLGEDFLAYLLSMVIQETATVMRRTTMGIPPARKPRRSKPRGRALRPSRILASDRIG